MLKKIYDNFKHGVFKFTNNFKTTHADEHKVLDLVFIKSDAGLFVSAQSNIKRCDDAGCFLPEDFIANNEPLEIQPLKLAGDSLAF